MLKYLILKDENFDEKTDIFNEFSQFDGPSLTANRMAALGSRPSKPKQSKPIIESVSLEAADLKEAMRDPTNRRVAPLFPTRLIQPKTLDIAAGTLNNAPWGLSAVGADVSNFDGSNVKVAVLDTGIDSSHEAFKGINIVEEDFSGSGNGDVQGHGTHCAGTIFGRDVGGTRIGVANGVSDVLIGKVLGDDGGGNSDMLFRGIQWAERKGAKVISMSLGFDFPGYAEMLTNSGWPVDIATSKALEGYRDNLRMFDALMQMMKANIPFHGGVVVAAASGNESRRDQNNNFEVSASLPAAANDIISVGALKEGNNGFTVASFSNTNPIVSAPGVNIVSAKNGGGLRALSGTSMACPHVAGIAALWWQSLDSSGQFNVNAETVATHMRANADTNVFDASVDINDRGEGLVKAPQ